MLDQPLRRTGAGDTHYSVRGRRLPAQAEGPILSVPRAIMASVASYPVTSMLPNLASAGFEHRRHGTLRVAVCDTDFLMNETKAAADPSTSLLAGFAGINVRAYAAQHVFEELYRDDGHGHPTKWHKLSEQAGQAHARVLPSTFRDAFEDRLLPKLTFVRLGDLFNDHPLVDGVRTIRSGRGASDVPTAQLAVLLSRLRPVAYSHDEHLYKPGVAPRPRRLPVVRGAENQVAQGEHLQVGAVGLTTGSIAGVDYVARSVGSWLGSPVWLTRAILLGIGAWALWSPARRAALARVLGPVGEAYFTQLAAVGEALALLDAAAAAVEPEDGIECRIAEVLVRQAHDGPLLAKDIQDGLTSCDPGLSEVPTINELRALLSATPCFEEGPRWRYSLGHRYARA